MQNEWRYCGICTVRIRTRRQSMQADGGGGAQSGRDQTRAGRHSINIALRFRAAATRDALMTNSDHVLIATTHANSLLLCSPSHRDSYFFRNIWPTILQASFDPLSIRSARTLVTPSETSLGGGCLIPHPEIFKWMADPLSCRST